MSPVPTLEPVHAAIRRTASVRLLSGVAMAGLGVLMLVIDGASGWTLTRIHGAIFCLIAPLLVRSGVRLRRPDKTRIMKTLIGDPEQITWVHTQRSPLITAVGGDMVIVHFRDGEWTSFHVRKRDAADVFEAISARAPGVVRPLTPDEARAHGQRVQAWKRSLRG
jgi:hypothetical protein